MASPIPQRIRGADSEASKAIALAVGATAFYCGLWFVVRSWPPWGDEVHFLDTVKLFSQGITIERLKAYPEMSGPLTFVVYGLWGRLAGLETASLRLLSPCIASLTVVAFWSALPTFGVQGANRSIAVATLALNPYFVGLSVFVFTDMIAMLGLAIVLIAVRARRPAIATLGIAVAVLARQYLAFVAPALVIAATLSLDHTPRVRLRWLMATLAGMAPLGLLVVLWNGQLAPAHAVRDSYLSSGLRFDPHALSLYLAILAVYLFPLVAVVLWRQRPSAWCWVVAAIAACIVLVFPVQPSSAQLREGVYTVGFVHRALAVMLPVPLLNLAFWTTATLGLAALMAVAIRTRRRRKFSTLSLWAAVASFLIVMPFSYMPWEKYALPLFMVAIPILAMDPGDETLA